VKPGDLVKTFWDSDGSRLKLIFRCPLNPRVDWESSDVSGWIKEKDTMLVIAVIGDMEQCLVLCGQQLGWSWIDSFEPVGGETK
jgi:hypothetical protein